MSFAAWSDCRDKSFTSDATTENPRPASPALAASILALSASKFVCCDTSRMLCTIPSRLRTKSVIQPRRLRTLLHRFCSVGQELAKKRVVCAKALLGLFYNRDDFIICASVQVSHKSIQDTVGSLELGYDSHGCQLGILDSALQMLA